MNNIIIIGAARSGTNMLRDILIEIPTFATWPCDEINYIWRHGVKKVNHDEFSKSDITPNKKTFIKRKFNWVRDKYKAKYVVEKTCANSLRVDYINELVDDSKFIFILRDPIDVVPSAEIRWKASLELDYIFKKARFVPITDIPYYSFKYLTNRIKKLFNKEKRLSYWGPRYLGFEKDSSHMDAIEISAKQWKKSVESSYESFIKMDRSKYIVIEYNNFVEEPIKNIEKILEFIGEDISPEKVKEIVKNVSNRSVGKGYNQLSEEQIGKINKIVGNTYEKIKFEFLKQ